MDRFPQFPEFPVEIRRMIWAAAIGHDQVRTLRLDVCIYVTQWKRVCSTAYALGSRYQCRVQGHANDPDAYHVVHFMRGGFFSESVEWYPSQAPSNSTAAWQATFERVGMACREARQVVSDCLPKRIPVVRPSSRKWTHRWLRWNPVVDTVIISRLSAYLERGYDVGEAPADDTSFHLPLAADRGVDSLPSLPYDPSVRIQACRSIEAGIQNVSARVARRKRIAECLNWFDDFQETMRSIRQMVLCPSWWHCYCDQLPEGGDHSNDFEPVPHQCMDFEAMLLLFMPALETAYLCPFSGGSPDVLGPLPVSGRSTRSRSRSATDRPNRKILWKDSLSGLSRESLEQYWEPRAAKDCWKRLNGMTGSLRPALERWLQSAELAPRLVNTSKGGWIAAPRPMPQLGLAISYMPLPQVDPHEAS